MTDLVNRQIEVYQSVWPDIGINIEVVGQIDSIIGAPEIVVQALEKLMSNAVDFREVDTAITIKVEREKELVSLSVINQGPSLPEEDIFASMVSKRKSTSSQPHLGLGLYIVRLVADYHRGYAFAQNLPGGVEVGFKLKI